MKALDQLFSKIKIWKPKYLYLFEIFLLISIQFVLTQTTWLKVLPPTNGFFLFWSKLSENQTPYLDFYLPLPPLGIWILGGIPRFFEDVLMAEQVVSLIVWFFLVIAVYALLRQFLSSIPAFFATSLSTVAYLVQPGNITAGYFELALAFFICAVSLLFLANKSSSKSSRLFYFLSGSFFASAILVKQSFLLPFALLAIVFLIFQFLGRKNTSVKTLLSPILGFLWPLIAVSLILAIQGSFAAAFTQIFSGGGKNISGSPWILWAMQSFLPSQAAWPVVLIAILFTLGLANYSKFYSLIILISISAILGLNVFVSGGTDASTAPLIILPLIVGISLYLADFKLSQLNSHRPRLENYVPFALWVLMFLSIVVSWNLPNFNGEQFSYEEVSVISLSIRGTLITVGAVGTIYLFSKSEIFDFKSSQISPQSKGYLYLGIASLGIIFMDSMSGGGGIESFILASAVGLGVFAKYLLNSVSFFSAVLVLGSIVLVFVLPLSSSQVRLPYNWFGIQEPALTEPRNLSNPSNLEAFQLAATTGNFYAEVNAFVDEIRKHQTATNQKESILIGTNIAGLAGGVLEIDTYDLNCPILWWDICPEDQSDNDLDLIKSNLPSGIIWGVTPESVIRAHEIGFRNGGTSSIREIQDWVLSQIDSGCYEKIGQTPMGVGTSGSNDWYLVAAVNVCDQ